VGKVGPARRRELTLLRDRVLVIARFIRGLQSSAVRDVMASLEDATNAAFERGSSVGLRMVERDLAESTQDLTEEQRRELDESLRSRFGMGLRDLQRKRDATIQRVVKRRLIANEDEHRLLLEYADRIHDDPSKESEMKTVNELLAARERSKSHEH
jgi:hypothetical protein